MKTNAEIVGTTCPFCLQMFEDGIRAKDIAELVAESVEGEG